MIRVECIFGVAGCLPFVGTRRGSMGAGEVRRPLDTVIGQAIDADARGDGIGLLPARVRRAASAHVEALHDVVERNLLARGLGDAPTLDARTSAALDLMDGGLCGTRRRVQPHRNAQQREAHRAGPLARPRTTPEF